MNYAKLKITAPLGLIQSPNPFEEDGKTPNAKYNEQLIIWTKKQDLDSAIDSNLVKGSRRGSLDSKGTYYWDGAFSLDMFNWDALLMVLSLGGEIENWPCFLLIDDPDKDVPEFVKNATYEYVEEDESVTTKTRTWKEWLRRNSTPYEYEGKWYVNSAASDGIPLNGSILYALNETDGITVIPFNELPKAEVKDEDI